LSNKENALRTNEVVGACYELSEINKSFTIFGAGIEFGNRMVTTSPVQNIEFLDDFVRFNTLNSSYQLEITERVDEDDAEI
jgi:hypothetical protein